MGSEMEVGFAKLQGEDFEYYMQTYSIVLGRSSKNADVDVDLGSLDGGMSISRRHARIFYDFVRQWFALKVFGKNGCFVEGVLHVPGNPSVKLDSQDLLQIGDKKFYFLLPTRSIFAPGAAPTVRHSRVLPLGPASGGLNMMDVDDEDDDGDKRGDGGGGDDDGDRDDDDEEEDEEEAAPIGRF